MCFLPSCPVWWCAPKLFVSAVLLIACCCFDSDSSCRLRTGRRLRVLLADVWLCWGEVSGSDSVQCVKWRQRQGTSQMKEKYEAIFQALWKQCQPSDIFRKWVYFGLNLEYLGGLGFDKFKIKVILGSQRGAHIVKGKSHALRYRYLCVLPC